ncbi:MAG: hypothetical protein HC814_02045 [Rhodobacteraceae bacterium]|nr:hypothetical protein [Paracoccaceae bacterium]
MVRVYSCHDETHYVVRRADGRPLAVPAWMTRPEAANACVVSTAHLPVDVLLELRRAVVTHVTSSVHNVHHDDHTTAPPEQVPAATAVRGGAAGSPRRGSPNGRRKGPAPSPDTVDAGGDQDHPPGERR